MPSPDENAAILRPVWEALVDEAFAHVVRVVDGATNGGLTVLLDKTAGTLPPNAHGTIADESVEVAFPEFPTVTDLESLLALLIAAIADLADAADPDTGGGAGGPDYLYWPDGTDPDWLTDDDGHLLRWEA